MATIGTFRPTKDGYEGTISTLTMGRKVRLVANDNKKHDDSPDYFVKANRCDLGFARKRTAAPKSGENEGRAYLEVFLDDPSFSEPVWAALFEREGGSADLVWSRRDAA